ncbi:hypothetical protein NHX12_003993 [Muraenolepis orangiensis]|uniref:Uncharacterized protein n=1 Tax=Muraenolepis orangiensis TaxID=630683 RepID=A0A9Q0IF48_9TELE|nr:hypothetical protein NHX12_003993 [Muraenolepis orangiensis]
MNRTLLLALIAKCQQMLLNDMTGGSGTGKDNQTTIATDNNININNNQTTTSTTTADAAAATAGPPTSTRSYDNAYFYILVVMFFYFFLTAALFKNFLGGDSKDPYREFIGSQQSSTGGRGKFNTGLASERVDFEEENSLC